ncbi:MAG: DUF3857 domain-containing transglutaminase family protein [Candidatus Zixiibacteriota bacterium]
MQPSLPIRVLSPVLLIVGCICSYYFMPSLVAENRQEPGANVYSLNIDSIVASATAPSLNAQFHRVYLLDSQSKEIFDDLTYVETVHQVFQITSAEGVQAFGTEVISYRDGFDSVAVIAAKLFSPNGDTISVPIDQIMSGISPSALMENDLYTDEREVRINFSGLNIGSIVELSYSIKHFHEILPYHSGTFAFRLPEPSRLGMLSITHSKNLKLFFKAANMTDDHFTKESSEYTTRTWVVRDNEPLTFERGASSFSDLTSRIDYSTVQSWSAFAELAFNSLWKDDWYQPLSQCETDYLQSIDSSALQPRERAKRIYRSMQRDFRYLGLELGIHNQKPHASALICEKRYGDCKDLSNLLVKLLRQIGIEAYPALLSTADNLLSLDEKFANYSFLNHCVVYVPDVQGASIWLDPTLQYNPFGWSSPMVHNMQSIVLKPDTSLFLKVPLNPAELDCQSSSAIVDLDSTGKAFLSGQFSLSGLSAVQYKSSLNSMTEEEIDNAMQQVIMSSYTSGHDLTYSLEGLKNSDSSFIINIKLVDDKFAQRTSEMLVIANRSGRFSDFYDNSGHQQDRVHDLYIYYTPRKTTESTMNYPSGYRPDLLPPNVSIENEFFRFVRTITLTADSNKYHSNVEMTVKTPVVPQSKYAQYKQAIDSVDAVMNESLILTKTKK